MPKGKYNRHTNKKCLKAWKKSSWHIDARKRLFERNKPKDIIDFEIVTGIRNERGEING